MKSRPALVACAAVCLLAAVGALLLHASSRATAHAAPPRHHPLAAAAPTPALRRSLSIAPSPKLRRGFGVFRRGSARPGAHTSRASFATTGAQAMTTREANRLTAPGGPTSGFGLNPSMTQEVAVEPSLHVWLVPGSRGVCLIQPLQQATGQPITGAYSSGCGSVNVAVEGGFWGTEGVAGDETVVGLAPDGNATVSVTSGDGSVQHVPVVDNVYAVRGADLRSVEVRDAGGTLRTFRLKLD